MRLSVINFSAIVYLHFCSSEYTQCILWGNNDPNTFDPRLGWPPCGHFHGFWSDRQMLHGSFQHKAVL